MHRPITEWAIICGLLAATSLSAGCSSTMGRYFAYLGWGGNTEDVKAEFSGLENKKVAVVVYTDLRTQYDYPDLNLTLSSAICGQLRNNVKGIELIPPTTVVHYQDENIYWDQMDRTELGKALGAQMVLFVPMEEFGTRLPDSAYLYRGRATCEPSVYDVSKPPRDARVYKGEKIRVRYPEHEPAGMVTEGDNQIRSKTEALFATELARRFYDHEKEIKP